MKLGRHQSCWKHPCKAKDCDHAKYHERERKSESTGSEGPR